MIEINDSEKEAFQKDKQVEFFCPKTKLKKKAESTSLYHSEAYDPMSQEEIEENESENKKAEMEKDDTEQEKKDKEEQLMEVEETPKEQ